MGSRGGKGNKEVKERATQPPDASTAAPVSLTSFTSSSSSYNLSTHGQQEHRPHPPRHRAASGNRWRDHRPLSQLRKSRGAHLRHARIDRGTGQGARKAARASRPRRAHGGAPAGDSESRRLQPAEKTAEEISSDAAGYSAAAITGG